MNRFGIALVGAVGWLALGCGGAAPAVDSAGKVVQSSEGVAVSQAAAASFKEALEAMVTQDKKGWTAADCSRVAGMFEKSSDRQSGAELNEALYNAGLVYQRCKDDKNARERFSSVLKANPKFHRARVQVALYEYRDSGEQGVEKAISEMTRAVTDAGYQNVEALVNLASFQMVRGGTTSDADGKDDYERAKKNLQRALAVDDSFMAAYNQLALYYLESAKQKAGRTRSRVAIHSRSAKKVDAQALELAALVCSQAVRKNPGYAPIHNTAGLIQIELGNLNQAVKEFGVARKLDPAFFEAQVNYAAVNLQFRGFVQAEEAYRAALALRPGDFEAHLGLALALRGQISDTNYEAMVRAADAELQAARQIAPDRPETYYNEAILTQGYKAKSGSGSSEAALTKAKELFGQFVAKAGAKAEYAPAVKRSKEHIEEIQQIIAFNKQTEAERKASEAEMKNRQAEEEASGKTEAAYE